MTNVIDFYFDFISPYSYLAHKKLKFLNKDNKLNINYKPILLGGLHKLGGITAPAFNERKMKNMKNDCELIAKKNKIEFKWNTKFPINSLYLMRGYLLINNKLIEKYLDSFFDAYWRDNLDILDEKIINKILDQIGFNKEHFFRDISNNKIKLELKKYTNDAFEKDIFGAPTFVVNQKIFWGQDRLDYAIEEFNHNS
jgi:2-hydroxychromene-2-carboxylate isomerase